MYLLQGVSKMNNKELNNKELKSALGFARFQRDRYFKQQQESHSELISSLDKLSALSEENISKKELYSLIATMFRYCRAHNLYEYYREDVTRLLVKLGDNENGNSNDSNK
jgi:hypothetical protein